jgi:hypothetical protein
MTKDLYILSVFQFIFCLIKIQKSYGEGRSEVPERFRREGVHDTCKVQRGGGTGKFRGGCSTRNVWRGGEGVHDTSKVKGGGVRSARKVVGGDGFLGTGKVETHYSNRYRNP